MLTVDDDELPDLARAIQEAITADRRVLAISRVRRGR
jgi:hypothetical protein